jgi:ligand-binding sensor domain-containing protein
MRMLLIVCFLLATAPAFALQITANSNSVSIGDPLTLNAQNYSGHLTWTASKGQIQGSGASVVYLPPAEAGNDAVTLLDSNGNVAVLALQVIAPAGATDSAVSLENAIWRLFLRRDRIKAIEYAADKRTVWVGTEGGLEQRDAGSGELLRVFSDADGMPGNNVMALLAETDGGLWVGTWDGGLGYHDAGGHWQTIPMLAGERITAIVKDKQGQIWVGTYGEDEAAFDYDLNPGRVFRRHLDGNWTVFGPDNSNSALSQKSIVTSLYVDTQDELWVTTYHTGVLHRDSSGQWESFNRYDDDNLPQTWDFFAVAIDSQGTLWIGSREGLARRDNTGSWTTLTASDMGLPDNMIRTLKADTAGGLWIGTGNAGLVYRSADGQWQYYNPDNTPLTSSYIRSLLLDPEGGAWVGTNYGGLYHVDAHDHWIHFSTADNGVASPHIRSILLDDAQLWVGTWLRGLAKRDADGAWTQYDMDNSPLPDVNVAHLVSDGTGGAWLSPKHEAFFTDGPGGLTHLSADGTWTTYTRYNSELPTNQFNALAADGQGGVWAASNFGLTHVPASGAWTVYNMDNSALPTNYQRDVEVHDGYVWLATPKGLYRLENGAWQQYPLLTDMDVQHITFDDKGGLWVINSDNQFFHQYNGQWRTFSSADTALPAGDIRTLLADGDALWIGTASGGLAYFDGADKWKIFDTTNSRIPGRDIRSLALDGEGGLWVGSENGGLAHLSFGDKQALSRHISDSAARTELLQGKRAALLIVPNGASSGYNQARAVDFMAGYAYHSLLARGYDNDEIYFLAYRPDLDINNDNLSDLAAVDAPISLSALKNGSAARDLRYDDVAAAFAWARAQGTLDVPLLVVFVNHGLPGALMLDPQAVQQLSNGQLGALLDDYQAATGNRVVVMLEACHSGTFASLSGANRLIVTSADAQLAYYADAGRVSFLKLYFDQLRRGDSFGQAWHSVRTALPGYRWPFNQQQPQLAGGGQELCLNGCWGGLPGVLTLTVNTASAVVPAGARLELDVRTSGVRAHSVWASVITPRIAAQRNEQGYSTLPTPVVNLRRSADEQRWTGRFSQFDMQGDYIFAVKARDADGFVSSATPLNVVVNQGAALQHARLSLSDGMLTVPVVNITDADGEQLLFKLRLQFTDWDNFVLDIVELESTHASPNAAFSDFSFATNVLHIPVLEVVAQDASISKLSVNLHLREDARFAVDLASIRSL